MSRLLKCDVIDDAVIYVNKALIFAFIIRIVNQSLVVERRLNILVKAH